VDVKLDIPHSGTGGGLQAVGRKMQVDITDGVQWLIQQGIADLKRQNDGN
jgi:hypothetical protein